MMYDFPTQSYNYNYTKLAYKLQGITTYLQHVANIDNNRQTGAVQSSTRSNITHLSIDAFKQGN